MGRSSIFISYRRNAEGGHFSLSLKNRLEKDGYDCFRDQEDLRQGDWRNQLFSEIDRRDYFILLLTEGAFDERGNGDAFIEEIERALSSGKKIIPFMLKGFDAESIPEELSAISDLEHIKLSDSSEGGFELAISRLERRFAKRGLNEFLHTAKGKAILVAVLVALVASAAALSYGLLNKQSPSSEERPVYYEDEVENGMLGNKIVFNSIVNNPNFGDERDFVGARLAERRDLWSSNINVANGQSYRIRIFVHNDNPNGEDTIAEGVRVSFSIPEESDTEAIVTGTILADNGAYSRYDDVAVFSSDARFHLEYVENSALWENNGIGSGGGIELDKGILEESGTYVGFSALDGKIPGGYRYDGYATIEVKVVYDEYVNDSSVDVVGSGSWAEALNKDISESQNPEAGFEMEVLARRSGSHEWVNTLNASVNDEIDYLIYYRNTSGDQQDDVMVRDVLPDNVEYIDGSTVLYNSSYQSGASIDQDDVATSGINIGSYAPNGNAYVKFRVKVVDKNLEPGAITQVVNWASITVDNAVLKDLADFYVSTDRFNVNVRVRRDQADEWSQYLDVGPNEEVEFIVYVENISNETANDVHINFASYEALEYVDGSAMLYNGSSDGTPIDSFGVNSTNIGSYAPGQSAYVIFKARVDPFLLEEGRNKLGMSAFVSCGHFIGSWSCAVYAER